MKKFLMLLVAMFATVNFLSAQDHSEDPYMENDWSFKARTAYVGQVYYGAFDSDNQAYLVGFGFEKMVTPYFGFGPELNIVMTKGADNVLINPSMNVKFNLANVFAYTGERHLFEPSFLVGLGYTSIPNTDIKIAASARAGFDFEFNLGESKEFAIMLSPRFYCADLNHFNDAIFLELGVGFVYHF